MSTQIQREEDVNIVSLLLVIEEEEYERGHQGGQRVQCAQ